MGGATHSTVVRFETMHRAFQKLWKGHILHRLRARFGNHRLRRLHKELLGQPFYQKRIQAYDAFFREWIPHSKKIYSPTDSQVLNAEYDAFVCGSDVIWSQDIHHIPRTYYLAFATDDKPKIAYAPSFGRNTIPRNHYEETGMLLSRFNALSVREESGRQIIRDAAGLDASVVADPTMLLGADEWDQVAITPSTDNTKYAFAYLLGVNKRVYQAIEEYCRNRDLKLVVIPYGDGVLDPWERDFGDEQILSASPGEWIGLIRDAEVVFTDSFHGTVFSAIYEKNFYVFRRYADSDRESMNTRVENLLDKLGITQRLVLPEELNQIQYEDIAWNEVRQRKDAFVDESMRYLKAAVTGLE